MKLGNDALIAIMAILQDGLLNGTDVSQGLRDLDLVVEEVGGVQTLHTAETSAESVQEA